MYVCNELLFCRFSDLRDPATLRFKLRTSGEARGHATAARFAQQPGPPLVIPSKSGQFEKQLPENERSCCLEMHTLFYASS